MPENETPTVVELPKPSKLSRVKDTAITVGIFVIPAAVIVGSMYAGMKVTKDQLEIAKLTLEAAKLNAKV